MPPDLLDPIPVLQRLFGEATNMNTNFRDQQREINNPLAPGLGLVHPWCRWRRWPYPHTEQAMGGVPSPLGSGCRFSSRLGRIPEVGEVRGRCRRAWTFGGEFSQSGIGRIVTADSEDVAAMHPDHNRVTEPRPLAHTKVMCTDFGSGGHRVGQEAGKDSRGMRDQGRGGRSPWAGQPCVSRLRIPGSATGPAR